MDKVQALHKFWSGFGLPAYNSSSIPSDAVFPYISYDAVLSDFGNNLQENVSVWYKGTSWVDATKKVNEISDYIGRGGMMIPYDGGGIWIRRGTNFAQTMADDNDLIRHYVLQLQIEFID